MVEHITNIADIPVIATVVRCDDDAHAKVRAGAKILNIAAGKNTPQVLRELRKHYPNLPLIAPAARRPRASVKPSPPAPTPSSGRRLRPSSCRPT